jgi:hypothetical protein
VQTLKKVDAEESVKSENGISVSCPRNSRFVRIAVTGPVAQLPIVLVLEFFGIFRRHGSVLPDFERTSVKKRQASFRAIRKYPFGPLRGRCSIVKFVIDEDRRNQAMSDASRRQIMFPTSLPFFLGALPNPLRKPWRQLLPVAAVCLFVGYGTVLLAQKQDIREKDREFLADLLQKRNHEDRQNGNTPSGSVQNIGDSETIDSNRSPVPRAELVVNSAIVRRAELVVRSGTVRHKVN